MMHSRKKISLVLCTYNGEEYIEELLNSIVYQTYKPDEIIVYDDYSTDNTVEILSKFMIKHSNLNWFLYRQNENVGWKKNFHDALKKATGDIIFLCDQDDIWFEHKIEKMTTAIEKNDRIKLLACSYKIRYEEDSKTKNQKLKNDNKIYRVKRSKDFIYPKRPGCTYAIKKEILLEFFKVWDSTSPHDAVLWKIA